MKKAVSASGAWRVLKWVIGTLAVLFLAGVLLPSLLGIPLQFVGVMLFGWIAYLGRVLPQITFNREIALDAAVALVLAVFGLHRMFSWWTTQRREGAKWRFRWTLQIAAMVLLLFATSIAAVGIVHQVAWLCREPKLIEMKGLGKQTRELLKIKHVAYALRSFAEVHGGVFPKSLDDLLPDFLDTNNFFFTSIAAGEPPERITYHSGYTLYGDPDTILLESSSPSATPQGRYRIVARLDTATVILAEEKFQELIRKQETVKR